MSVIKGYAYKSSLTKLLIQKLKKNNIAVIKHRAIDLVAAQDLKYKKAKAVINFEKTVDPLANLEGVCFLLNNNIKIFDVYEMELFDTIYDMDIIEIVGNRLYVNNAFYANCTPVIKENVDSAYAKDLKARYNFIKNTLFYMNSELDYFITDRNFPDTGVNIRGKDVVIISRGRYYREDLKTIKHYILSRKPVLIGVDGGADAVDDIGLKNDIIIGDMDSVSDRSLQRCKEILVHSYSNSYAPGKKRVMNMNLKYQLLKVKGTSEDAALYYASSKGANTICLIGSHNCIEEFAEKGRQGAGSTMLLRMLTGVNIVDLKGVNSIVKYTAKYYLKAATIFSFFLIAAVILLPYKNLINHLLTSLKIIFNFK